MKSVICAIVFFVLVCHTFYTSQALTCYSCSGPMNQSHDCEVNVTAKNLTQECSPGFVCTVFIEKSDNQSFITRLCHQPNECEILEKANTTHGLGFKTITYCTTCNTSLCNVGNSGNSYISSSSWIIISLGVTFMGIFSTNVA
ncbi:uncharacterized protein LOC126737479 [Anthonomus grandis grandis]|uniref:uncharacterized protein LOC126737479 n=1 Tax=Anthonomus grandis grandis TaxID=2921223 RepID=UPI002166AD10|nr:uncharacterized protein LOC126737479 [Anthonomus grandis grandis]